ncbi:MAG TPA: rhodanese-like domain-containing protein, partial [Candidatus Binatia bacterium]|nr:rhodanese-like domain-containing protein [Candidatus Binatia bacterium]
MTKTISCQDLAQLMASNGLLAVFDVRERGEYNECQIPNTTSLPRSQIEFRIAELVPNHGILIVVYDEGGKRAPLAAETMTGLGYKNVAILQGGLAAWQLEGRATIDGVNVPSKAFGERVYHDQKVPELSAEELSALLESEDDLTILDMRTPEEYGRFCIPGGLNVPGGDLILWVDELRQKPSVIVNCAGRTRSIIGAAALRRMGLSNVRALKNGTMGWVLAGFELERNPARRGPSAPSESKARAAAIALRIAAEENISRQSVADVSRLIDGVDGRVSYLIDVRSEEEFVAGHVARSVHVPGGQAVQRADDFVPVRNADIIFISNDGTRAVMAAYWYQQMGFPNVSVLQGGLNAWKAGGQHSIAGAADHEPLGFDVAQRGVRRVEPIQLRRRLESETCLTIDVSTSLEFDSAHVPDAKWISRGWIDVKLPDLYSDRDRPIVLTCRDGRQ